MKRAVIFDFGGVLMKTLDYRPRHAWDERLSLPHGSVESIVHGSEIWHKTQLGQVTVTDYWNAVARRLGLRQDEIGQFERDYFSGDVLDTNLVNYIQDLRAIGHPIALLSNDSPTLADKLDALGVAHLFDPLVISAHIGVMKPNPTAYLAVLEQLQRKPLETIFVDDRLENVEAANALGIYGIHYRSEIDLAAVLAPLLTG
jgi:epoxide hydrolase-like predicted phosphatase